MKFSTLPEEPESSTTILSLSTSGIFAPKISTRLRISGLRSDDFDEDEFPFHVIGAVELNDGFHVDKFSELFFDLFEHGFVAGGDDGHAGELGVVRAVDRKGFDVVSASAEKSGNARERAEFVGD